MLTPIDGTALIGTRPARPHKPERLDAVAFVLCASPFVSLPEEMVLGRGWRTAVRVVIERGAA